ncbi:DUF1850 domain-containing protein [Roseinatronobacter sp. NSM]|uniref:DUF1850 domain-containing protein n=1 Tax=Roseinatronobacter sp. NSM TaxID=3457785 RepID=UPI00403668D0
MTAWATGRVCLAALFAPVVACADAALHLQDARGAVLAQLPMPADTEICLRWAHSVTGGAVADCFENRAGQLTLTRSYLHDFAAGLGEVAGRGTLVAAQGGGYWIVGIDEALFDNSLTLRVGSEHVGHRLTAAGHDLALLDHVDHGARVRLQLNP